MYQRDRIIISTLVSLVGVLLPAAMPAQEAASGEGKAKVIVYRVGRYSSKLIKPGIFCDGREVGYMANARYFTLALPAGKHRITSNDDQTFVSLDVKPGNTYYVRVSLGKQGAWVRVWFGVETVESAEALKDLARLKPAASKHVLAPEIVSVKKLSAEAFR